MTGIKIIPLVGLDARFVERPWPWAEANRSAIEAHWSKLTENNPSLFNGRVLLARERRFDGGVYRAAYAPVDYASFLAWRDFGWPDRTISNGFGMAALRTADGAFVLGIMGEKTANAGRIYFPAGTPDLDDVTGEGMVDLAGSVMRELAEETGLSGEGVMASDRWTAVVDGQRTALMREVRSPLTAAALNERVRSFLAGDAQAELAGIRMVRSSADIDEERMPDFVKAYLRYAFR